MSTQDGGGGRAEEAVRAFFLNSNFFAARGIKFRFDGEEVTDLDLWAYGAGSLTHRERVIVDCKYKIKHAQAFERVLWAEGLRRATYSEHAVVATTDGRESVRALAARMQIRLIGPDLLADLINKNSQTDRLAEEDFLRVVLPEDDKLVGRIRDRIEGAKGLLLKADFDSINAHLSDLKYFAEESTRVQARTGLVRAFYLSSSFFLIALDYILRDASFLDSRDVRGRIEEGVRFGTRGRAGARILLASLGPKKRSELMRAAETVRADILGEFIVRHAGTNWFFQTALALEAAAYHKRFTPIAQLPLAAQSVIGLLLDFHEIDRHILFGIND